MLDKITKGDWETSQTTIQTSGGCFIGYASSRTNAKIMAASKKFFELLQELGKENKEISDKIEEILKSV